MNKISILYIILFISGSIFSMGHLDHEKKGLHPVAASGQVVVTYKADCKRGDPKKAMKLIDEIISYEKKNSPIKYSSAPGTWSDSSVGAVDLHASQKAMDDAFEWQAGNKKWSNMFDQIASACGITTDDFVIDVMKAK